MRPNFISEEQFAEMTKGLAPKAKAVKPLRGGVTLPSPLRRGPAVQSFFVPGILPGQNTILGRGTRWLYSKEKKIWGAKALRAIADAKLHPMQRVHITWGWVERNARRDPDNFTGLGKKFLLDAMVKSGLIPDDSWAEIAGWTDLWHVEADNPGVQVTIQEVEVFDQLREREDEHG